MKSLLKIIRRYSLTVGAIFIILLLCNVAVFFGISYMTVRDAGNTRYGRDAMEQVGGEMSERDGTVRISAEGEDLLESSSFVWAMALDGDGNAVWEWRLPKEIKKSYSLWEVSAFSRWYLKGYPVRTWKSGELLLVFGCGREEMARYDLLMSRKVFEFIPVYVRTAAVANLAVILLFIFCFGFRFYQSVKPAAEGIEKLALGEAADVPESGPMEELARKINGVSEKLLKQQRELERRDEARTAWIAGVSHDIRTPLSLIMGYADKLAKDPSLAKDSRGTAEMMKRQSLIIRQLIADLNLTSKLAYQAQPLKKKLCSPAAVLRDCAADFYNGDLQTFTEGGISEDFSIEIIVGKEAEGVRISADEGLLKRALRNLIGNSIRHGGEGCQVTVSLSAGESEVRWLIKDTGSGIPEAVVQNMGAQEGTVHIMGLRLADQIARAHGGKLSFIRRDGGNYDAEVTAEIPGKITAAVPARTSAKADSETFGRHSGQ